jgi:hypothetical protein
MKHSLGKITIATTVFVSTALLSFGWSEQRGVWLSTESAQARVGRPLTPGSVAGVARRQNRRGGYGYGAGAVGAGVVAGLIGTAAIAAATSGGYGYGYDDGGGYGDGSGYGGGYSAPSPWGDHECLPDTTHGITHGCRPHATGWGPASAY